MSVSKRCSEYMLFWLTRTSTLTAMRVAANSLSQRCTAKHYAAIQQEETLRHNRQPVGH